MFHRRYSSLGYLTGAVPRPRPVPAPAARSPAAGPPKGGTQRLIYTPSDLALYFHDNSYSYPQKRQLSQADLLFYNSKASHEWTCIDYADLPDVKYEALRLQRQLQLDKLEPYHRLEYHDNLANARTSFGIEPSLLRPLPEVLFLGHTNAGKSTLINSLFLLRSDAKTPNVAAEFAYVSKREGYTKCLNGYNLGNKLRLIDSPGYGRFGEESQGKVVLDYIRNRKQLRRTFLLIDSLKGLRDEDGFLVDHLTELGAPFEVVWTKVDELTLKIHQIVQKAQKSASGPEIAKHVNSRLIEHYSRLIDDSGLGTLASLPRILFNNSHSNSVLGKRHGFHEIRYAVAESCGLVEPASVPLGEGASEGRRKATRSLKVTQTS